MSGCGAVHEVQVPGLWALVAVDDVVRHPVALGERGQPSSQCPDVDEDVFTAGLRGDEPEALVAVVPRHGAVGAVGRTGPVGTGPVGTGPVGTGLVGTGAERQQVLGLHAPLPLADQESHPLSRGDHAASHDG